MPMPMPSGLETATGVMAYIVPQHTSTMVLSTGRAGTSSRNAATSLRQMNVTPANQQMA